MTTRLGLLPALVTGAALIGLVGCAPTDVPGGIGDITPTQPGTTLEVDAAWLHGGSMIGLLTWGSSGCAPYADEVSLDGETLTIALSDPALTEMCTKDYTARIAPIAVPEGVDPTQPLQLEITTGVATGQVTIEGDSRLVPHGFDNWEPSAGWFDDLKGIALLTFGSSSCPPIIDGVEVTGSGEVTVSVGELPADRACTMDMAPRVIYLAVEGVESPEAAELVLVGAEFDSVRIPIYGYTG